MILSLIILILTLITKIIQSVHNFMSVEKINIENPESIIQAAISHELMENPYCPIPGLLNELLEFYRLGDKSALDMALIIANELLAPRNPSIFQKITDFIRKQTQ